MRIRVFVFDDNEAIRSMLWHVLDSRGYQVFTFPDPGMCPLHLAPGCQCPENQACGDIIISDLDMPNVNGLEFIENQMKKGCKVKNVALMSGAWSDEDFQYAQRLGCQLFRKPFTIDEINNWLDKCEEKIHPNRILSDWFQQGSHPSVTDERG